MLELISLSLIPKIAFSPHFIVTTSVQTHLPIPSTFLTTFSLKTSFLMRHMTGKPMTKPPVVQTKPSERQTKKSYLEIKTNLKNAHMFLIVYLAITYWEV